MIDEPKQNPGGSTYQTDDGGKPPAAPVLPDLSPRGEHPGGGGGDLATAAGGSSEPPADAGSNAAAGTGAATVAGGDASKGASETTPAAGAGSATGGGAGAAKGASDPSKPATASKPTDLIAQIAYELALADAMKPLQGAITDVHSMAAGETAVRDKLRDAYNAAVAADGPLTAKWQAAQTSFDRATVDMDSDKRLDNWLASALGDKGGLKGLLVERAALAVDLATPMGPNEKLRAEAQEATKAWAARYADWSAPVDKITAQIGQYAAKIDPLNADINNEVKPSAALTSFWFEVAPKHLQLAPKLGADVAAAVAKVAGALEGFDDLQAQFNVGAERTDGSLYLVATGQDAEDKRKAVLDKWREAATRQAEAEASFKLAPDDAATRKQRWDKLKGDAWIAEAKKLPEPKTP